MGQDNKIGSLDRSGRLCKMGRTAFLRGPHLLDNRICKTGVGLDLNTLNS